MKRQSGFTLMELLIVIGVLGILAAGLLAAIDPFEQLKKARDSNYRSAALELLSATQRYMANHGYFPWTNAGSACATELGGSGKGLYPSQVSSTSALLVELEAGNVAGGPFADCLQSMVDDGELKSSFSQGLGANVYMSTWGKTNVRVCFAPEGKSNRSDKSTNVNIDNITFTDSVSSGGIGLGCDQTQRDAGECLQCFQ